MNRKSFTGIAIESRLDTLRRRLALKLIQYLAFLGPLDVTYVPWGAGGDALAYYFRCQECHTTFLTWVSLYNEQVVTCPRCKAQYLTANDAIVAWIRRPWKV